MSSAAVAGSISRSSPATRSGTGSIGRRPRAPQTDSKSISAARVRPGIDFGSMDNGEDAAPSESGTVYTRQRAAISPTRAILPRPGAGTDRNSAR